ncbi:MAG: fimbrillin family protein [Muribaculaceae bacterium]|nr:fimbrillin family protein [Muribaculaceae bacterium]
MKFTDKWTWAAAMLLSACAVSCSDNDDPQQDANELPDNTYPVEFTASIEQLSRSTADDSWNGDESITVQSVLAADQTSADWSAAHSAVYTPAQGKLTTGSPAYWTRKDEVRQVRAWYLGNGTTSTEIPSQWTVGADQSQGHQNGDLLYAYGTARFEGANNLTFYHQTAKAVVNVKVTGNSGMGVASVKIGDNNLAVDGTFTAPTDGATAGSWTPGNANATITPLSLTALQGYDASCSALLIPQNIAGKTFLTVTMSDGTSLSWNATDATDLIAGRMYTYEATVNHELKTIEVKVVTGATWGNGENKDVASSADQYDYGTVKIGDYYYDDGSWSDGGFLGFNTSGNGSVNWASPKPAPVSINPYTGAYRSVIGIVYSTDLSRMGDAEKAALAAKGYTPHGLVMCSTSLKDLTQWSSVNNDESTIGIPFVTGTIANNLYYAASADISGYNVQQTILKNRATDVADGKYLAISDAMAMHAPKESTGWYVPAAGQIIDIYRNLTGLNFTDTSDFYFTNCVEYQEDGLWFRWQLNFNLNLQDKYKEHLTNILNATLAQIPDNDKTLFDTGAEAHLTSSLGSASQVVTITTISGKLVEWRCIFNKSNWYKLRPVLAF